MKFLPRLFFDTATTENNGGGAAAETKEEITNSDEGKGNQQAAPVQEVPKQIISDEELKNYGFDSADQLKDFLKKQKEENISDEEKKVKANQEKADFLKFSADQKLLNVEDYSQYESVKAKADRDLVFEKHLEEFKTDHPEITDKDELEEAAKEDFEFEYKLNSESEAVKKRAEAKLAKEAKEIRSPYETKVTTAQSKFKENRSIRETLPKFEEFVNKVIEKNTPDKIVAYKAKDGDTDIDIEIELTKEDKEAIAKAFKTPKTFNLFASGKPDEVAAKLDNKIQGWIKANKSDEIASKSFLIGKGIATKSSAVTGADNPYALNQGGVAPKDTSTETLEESNARMAAIRKKYNQSRY